MAHLLLKEPPLNAGVFDRERLLCLGGGGAVVRIGHLLGGGLAGGTEGHGECHVFKLLLDATALEATRADGDGFTPHVPQPLLGARTRRGVNTCEERCEIGEIWGAPGRFVEVAHLLEASQLLGLVVEIVGVGARVTAHADIGEQPTAAKPIEHLTVLVDGDKDDLPVVHPLALAGEIDLILRHQARPNRTCPPLVPATWHQGR